MILVATHSHRRISVPQSPRVLFLLFLLVLATIHTTSSIGEVTASREGTLHWALSRPSPTALVDQSRRQKDQAAFVDRWKHKDGPKQHPLEQAPVLVVTGTVVQQ